MESAFMDRVLSLADGAFEVLFPRECLICTRPLRGQSLCFRCAPPPESDFESARCDRCFNVLREPSQRGRPCSTCLSFPLPVRRLRYLWEYDGLARDFIRAMKFRPSITLARLSGELMAKRLETLFEDRSWDALIPVPASPTMLRRRRFHPCYEMSRAISNHHRELRIISPIRHARHRPPQSTLSHEERLRGLKNCFKLSKGEAVKGKKVLLIEDVITTGATLSAISKLLYEAGAAQVDVLALAQARAWNRFRARLFQVWGAADGEVS